MPEVLSEDTPIIMEKDDCSVRFTPSNETLESLKAEGASPHIKKEKTETLYESEKTVPISAVYKSEDKNAEIKYTSGNKGEGTLDVTAPSDGTAARIIEAGIQIDKGDRPEDVTGFIIPADQQELKLKDNAGTAEWYVAGSKTSPQIKDADGNSTIGEDTWQEILAVKNDETSGRKYSVDVLENGEKKSVNYTSSQISGSTGTKEISFTNNAVSFRIKAKPGVATYKVRAETASGSGSYVTVQPDTTYYVSDITDSAAYTRVFTVKATAQSGKNLNDSSLTIYADTMHPEVFCIEVHSVKNVQEERLI